MAFWIPAILATIIVIGWMLWPLLRREKDTPASASYDMQVFKDQLKEIKADEARGVISATEAQRVRTEVSRRLLAAAKLAEAEPPIPNAPGSTTIGLAAVISLSIVLGGVGLYFSYGAPGYRDLPQSENLARRAAANDNRPSQTEAEEFIAARQPEENPARPDVENPNQNRDDQLIEQLITVLQDRPDDLEGYRMLTRALASSGRMIEAHAAMDVVLGILGGTATPEDHLEHAEIMILATQGYVSPDAINALDQVMPFIPDNPRARYYAGLALAQYGQPRRAYALWSQLLLEGPEDAPWIAAIRAGIDGVAAEAGISPQAPLAGPSAEQVEAAEELSTAERSDMIRTMVGQLTERLANEGGTLEEWLRLITSNNVLGEQEAATKALEDARAIFADDPAALARIEAAGAELQ